MLLGCGARRERAAHHCDGQSTERCSLQLFTGAVRVAVAVAVRRCRGGHVAVHLLAVRGDRRGRCRLLEQLPLLQLLRRVGLFTLQCEFSQ